MGYDRALVTVRHTPPFPMKRQPITRYVLPYFPPFLLSRNPGVRSGSTACTKGSVSLHPKDNKKFWEELSAYVPLYDTGHIENDASDDYSIVAFVFITPVTCLPSRCLATMRGTFTEPLPSNDRGDAQTAR
jgi:hypothetical protein